MHVGIRIAVQIKFVYSIRVILASPNARRYTNPRTSRIHIRVILASPNTRRYMNSRKSQIHPYIHVILASPNAC